MLDLLSVRCRVHGELMITDQQDGGYMATTLAGAVTKSTGAALRPRVPSSLTASAATTNVACETTGDRQGRGLLGVRIDASHIHIPRRKDVFVGRLVLMVENAYWLVIDRVSGTQ